MSIIKLSWRYRLAAVVAVPFLAWLSLRVAVAETAEEKPAATAVHDGSHEAQPIAEGQRAEGAFRELRERAAVVERELKELGDGHPEKAEALKRELIGIRERMQQLRPRSGAEGLQRLKAAMRELKEKIGAGERALHELGDGQAEKAEALKRELNAMREKMQQLRRQAEASEKERVEGAAQELHERAAAIERQLHELGDSHPDKAEALKRELNEIRERLQQLRKNQEAANRYAPGEFRELRERAAALERELKELGENHPDRAEAIKREISAIHEKAQRLYKETGRPVPQPAASVPQRRAEESAAMTREIAELRGQVREMREEMEKLRAEIHKLLEREANEKD